MTRRLVPYLLLAMLTLGTGLGVGLGLAGGPNIVSTSPIGNCSVSNVACIVRNIPGQHYQQFAACMDRADARLSLGEPNEATLKRTLERCVLWATDG